MNSITEHPDADVAAALLQLQKALIAWERATGRDSLLIFREAAGHIAEHGPMPSQFSLRLDKRNLRRSGQQRLA